MSPPVRPDDGESPRAGAVALRTDTPSQAPRVVAKGYGDVAEAIMARAEQQGLHVHRSPELMRLLMRVDLDERIPAPLYLAVAELLEWAYRLDAGLAPSGQA